MLSQIFAERFWEDTDFVLAALVYLAAAFAIYVRMIKPEYHGRFLLGFVLWAIL